jgi:hypothetical protein
VNVNPAFPFLTVLFPLFVTANAMQSIEWSLNDLTITPTTTTKVNKSQKFSVVDAKAGTCMQTYNTSSLSATRSFDNGLLVVNRSNT